MASLLLLLQPLNWRSTSMPFESSIPTTFNGASSPCGEDIIISSITKTTLSLSDRTSTLPPNISEIISILNESKVSILPFCPADGSPTVSEPSQFALDAAVHDSLHDFCEYAKREGRN